jgi:hypothetical protein
MSYTGPWSVPGLAKRVVSWCRSRGWIGRDADLYFLPVLSSLPVVPGQEVYDRRQARGQDRKMAR